MKLHVIKPSVNSLAVRAFVRAAGLEVEEIDAYGQTRSDDYLAKCPAHLAPMIESPELPNGALWESCAIMQYLCDQNGLDKFYPKDHAARAMQDSAMYYVVGTLYPLLARATYPVLGFPGYPGEVATSNASDADKEAAREDAENALAEPLEACHAFFLKTGDFIGGTAVSIADIRLAASLEFLAMIDYPKPDWLTTYLSGLEGALGDAYLEPAADVRGYIEYVRSQAA